MPEHAEQTSVKGRTSKRTIIQSAIKLFEKHGVRHVSMKDISAEANISRKTLYRIYRDRSSLMDDILKVRLIDMEKKSRRELARFNDVKEALVEGSISFMDTQRKDKLFNDILQHEANIRLEQYVFPGNEAMRRDLINLWSPVLEQGRQQRLLREDVSFSRIVEIITGMHSLLIMHKDYSKEQQRQFLVDFLLPVVLVREAQ